MKGSVVIVIFFVLGVYSGMNNFIPYSAEQNNLSFYVLCCLMFFVGFSIGANKDSLESFKKIHPYYFLLPVVTVVGTLVGVTFLSLFFANRSLQDVLAVGSGFGYYSLSAIFISKYKGAELGTVALLANITREILTLLLAPLMVKYFGRLAPISAGGATTMDTTLPVISKYSGKEYVVVSVFHGVIVDLSVPFLVTLFCLL
ncbi:lysine exporter LysO family protein [Paludibacter sp.]